MTAAPSSEGSGADVGPEGRIAAATELCQKCGGDGYVECWNHDHSDVVITLCTDCGPAPGDFDG